MIDFSAISSSPISATLVSPRLSGGSTTDQFQRLFQAEASPEKSPESRRAEVREAAVQLVATAFIKPVLEQLRESRSQDGPFAPGPAERRFGPLLDEQVADRLVEAANFDLIDVIADRFMPAGEIKSVNPGGDSHGE